MPLLEISRRWEREREGGGLPFQMKAIKTREYTCCEYPFVIKPLRLLDLEKLQIKRKSRLFSQKSEFQIMNIFKKCTDMSNIAWNILELKNCLKFKSNWASCILSDKPTDGHVGKRTRWGWNPAAGRFHTDQTQENTNDKLKGHYTGYSHRPTSQEGSTTTTPRAVVRTVSTLVS